MTNNEQLVESYYDDLILFCQDILNVNFTDRPQQVEFLLAIQNKKFVCVRAGHKVFKTASISMAMLWILMTRADAKVLLLSGILLGGMKSTVLPEIRLWLNNAPKEFQNLLSDTFQQTWSSGGLYARSPSINKGDGVVGTHTPGSLFVVIDEAASARDEIFDSIEGSLQGNDVYCVLPSNPRYNSGFFHEICMGKDKRFEVLHFSSLDNPLLDIAWAESIKDRYGENSTAYRVKVLGEFPNQSKDCVYNYDIVVKAMDRKGVKRSSDIIWALDPAAEGTDDCCLAKRQGDVIYQIESLQGSVKPDQVVSWVTEIVINTKPEDRPKKLICDKVGLGSLMYFFELEKYGIEVVELNPGWSPINKERFAKLKDELYWTFRDHILDTDVEIIYNSNLLAQMAEITYSYKPNGQITVRKDKMKHSPNELDCVAYTYFCTPEIFIA